MADAKQRINPTRQIVLKSSYTAIPNFILETSLRIFPYEATHFLLYLCRKIVGYVNSDGTLEMSIGDIEMETKMSHDTISRWAHAFSAIGFAYYLPASNGARKSTFGIFPFGLPDKDQLDAAHNGIASAVRRAAQLLPRRLGSKEFAALVRDQTIKWRIRTCSPEEKQVILTRIAGDLKGLV